MMDFDFHDSLHQEIDEGATELGEQIAADLPSTVAEVRSEIPADLSEQVTDSDDVSDHRKEEILDTLISPLTDQGSK